MFFPWHILLLYQQVVQAASSSSTATVMVNNNSTCASRTVNYLTHTLPQQCLTSSRAAVSTQTVYTTVDQTTSENGETIPSQRIPSTHVSNTQVVSTGESFAETTSTATTESAAISQPSVMTVTATQVSNQELGPVLPEIVEEDSPLESGNFLSFEEWKKQNLQKAGQSEHIGRDAKADKREGRKRQPNLQNSLDSLGDDVEIDLDFSGFVPDGPEKPRGQAGESSEVSEDAGSAKLKVSSSRKKDAGTTCKERFNYASFDCAASMLKTNPQAKSPGSVLNENKDAYMLNECSAENKFIIVELCHDILVDTVVLANFEFFSSIFRLFRVSVSDRYPAKADKWKSLGVFEARNSREVQAFLVEDPMIWARYLRVEFLTHYGSEFYCPVSLVRVHGTTMLEEYKHDMDNVTEDDDEDAEVADSTMEEERLVPEAVDQGILDKERQELEDLNSPTESHDEVDSVTAETAHPALNSTDSCSRTDVPVNATLDLETMLFTPLLGVCSDSEAPDVSVPTSTEELSKTSETATTPAITPLTGTTTSNVTSTPTITSDSPPPTVLPSGNQTQVEAPLSKFSETTTHSANSTQTERITTVPSHSPPVSISTESPKPVVSSSPDKSESPRQTDHTSTSVSTESAKAMSTTSTERVKQSGSATTSSEKVKQSGSATHSPPASPTMQESFFKSVQKRLQMLESNSSLSLQYIEEQSRALRDAFRKVEQRQLSKTSIFLEHLNSTVLTELREFRQQYDQLWQSTVIELEMQREQYQRENRAMHARLGVLADELIFQKRLSILQMTLILVCLGLVLFSRGAINNYLELPLVQSVLSKSPSTRWMNLSGDSPSNPRKLSRARSEIQIGLKSNGILKGHHRIQSDDSNITDGLSQTEMYSPPTPVSFDGLSDASHSILDDGKLVSDPEFDPETIERPSTSPPTLAAHSDPTTPRLNETATFASLETKIVSPGESRELLPSSRPTSKAGHPSPSKHLKWKLPESDG